MKRYTFPYYAKFGRGDYGDSTIDVELTNREAQRLEKSAKEGYNGRLDEDDDIDDIFEKVMEAIYDREGCIISETPDIDEEEYEDVEYGAFYPEELKGLALNKLTPAKNDTPKKFFTKEECLLALEQDPWNIKYCSEESITEDMVLSAINNKGYVFKYIPEKFKTKEICLIAVRNYGPNLQDVPSEIIDKELCLEAIKSKSCGWKAIFYVPKELRDSDICLAAGIQKD